MVGELSGKRFRTATYIQSTRTFSRILIQQQMNSRCGPFPGSTDERTEKNIRQTELSSGSKEVDNLFAVLKAVRTQIAQQENVPAYIVFSNATLMDMAVKAPPTMAEFLDVSGVGETKAARYGEVFLKAIAAQKEDSAHES